MRIIMLILLALAVLCTTLFGYLMVLLFIEHYLARDTFMQFIDTVTIILDVSVGLFCGYMFDSIRHSK